MFPRSAKHPKRCEEKAIFASILPDFWVAAAAAATAATAATAAATFTKTHHGLNESKHAHHDR